MDFDSIITFILIIIFFALPSLLKQIQARKKKKGVPKKAKKSRAKPFIFEKISRKIRQFVQELEKRGRQEKSDQDTIWETLAEDENENDLSQPEPDVPDEQPGSVKEESRAQKPLKEPVIEKATAQPLRSGGYRVFKSDPLQNAVIWSEILSKPVALRDE